MNHSRSKTRPTCPPSPPMTPPRAPPNPEARTRPNQPTVPPPSSAHSTRSPVSSSRRHLPSPAPGDHSSPETQKDSQISNRALYDVIVGLPGDVRCAVIALLSDMHESELPRAKERIVACRRAWDEWNAMADGTQSCGGAGGGAAPRGGGGGEGGARERPERMALGGRTPGGGGDTWPGDPEAAVGGGSGRAVGAEEAVLRNRYLLARARILHFGAFEYRPEWRRERERRRGKGPDGEGGAPGTG
jgi:hypothetical protein